MLAERLDDLGADATVAADDDDLHVLPLAVGQ
jgi:hypothetical protein